MWILSKELAPPGKRGLFWGSELGGVRRCRLESNPGARASFGIDVPFSQQLIEGGEDGVSPHAQLLGQGTRGRKPCPDRQSALDDLVTQKTDELMRQGLAEISVKRQRVK